MVNRGTGSHTPQRIRCLQGRQTDQLHLVLFWFFFLLLFGLFFFNSVKFRMHSARPKAHEIVLIKKSQCPPGSIGGCYRAEKKSNQLQPSCTLSIENSLYKKIHLPFCSGWILYHKELTDSGPKGKLRNKQTFMQHGWSRSQGLTLNLEAKLFDRIGRPQVSYKAEHQFSVRAICQTNTCFWLHFAYSFQIHWFYTKRDLKYSILVIANILFAHKTSLGKVYWVSIISL